MTKLWVLSIAGFPAWEGMTLPIAGLSMTVPFGTRVLFDKLTTARENLNECESVPALLPTIKFMKDEQRMRENQVNDARITNAPAVPVFISFDAEHDEALKGAIIGQSKYRNSPFSIRDRSVQQPFRSDWQEKTRRLIKQARVMCVICGQHTHKASGVSIEIEIARSEGIRYFLLQGYSDRPVTKPKKTYESDKVHPWNLANLDRLINGRR